LAIDRVVFSGLDHTADLDLVMSVDHWLNASVYPKHQVRFEYGILVSRNNDRPRYPTFGWINRFADMERDQTTTLSLHLCGAIARDYINGEIDHHGLPEAMCLADRIQLNGICKMDYRVTGLVGQLFETQTFMKRQNRPNFRFIMQIDSPENLYKWAELHTAGIHIDPMFDSSGGLGKTIAEVPEPPRDAYVGYAGGISPDNLLDIATKIVTPQRNKPKQQNIWLDMESSLRNPETDQFSVGQMLRVIEKITSYLNQTRSVAA